jgi:hypothetical protein
MATMEDIQLSQGHLKIFIILGAFPSGNNFSLKRAGKARQKGCSDAKAERYRTPMTSRRFIGHTFSDIYQNSLCICGGTPPTSAVKRNIKTTS